MKFGKLALMTGVAAVAMLTAAQAKTADANGNGMATTAAQTGSDSQAPLVLAQNSHSTAELEARISALEEEVQKSEMNAAAAMNAPPPAASGWFSNTSISGRMYYDVTNISNTANGTRNTTAASTAATVATPTALTAGTASVAVPSGATNGNGTNFDIKRFYIGIDHTFDSVFSANVTTDTTYDGTTGVGQLFLKKAYLQAKIDPLLILRVGAADLPWIPYVEGIYGYRYFEKTLVDRTNNGTSSDWGVHALGSAFDGILNWDFAAVNGAGYKKTPIGGDVNRFNTMDFEGRVSAVYDGFNVAVGGYHGDLGLPSGLVNFHAAERWDVLGAYVGNGIRIGVEYFHSNDYTQALVSSPTTGDKARGTSAFGSYNFWFAPEFAVFARYDTTDPTIRTAPAKHDELATLGVSWSPVKIVDISLAWKHEDVTGGSYSASNGAIGSTTGLMKGVYNEVGVFGDLQF